MALNYSKINWLVPWQRLLDRKPDDDFVKELRCELCPSHILFGVPLCSVANRQDCDDVLFELLDDSGRFAVVHLAHAQHPEPNPLWPETTIYRDWNHFENERMKQDHIDWTT